MLRLLSLSVFPIILLLVKSVFDLYKEVKQIREKQTESENEEIKNKACIVYDLTK